MLIASSREFVVSDEDFVTYLLNNCSVSLIFVTPNWMTEIKPSELDPIIASDVPYVETLVVPIHDISFVVLSYEYDGKQFCPNGRRCVRHKV